MNNELFTQDVDSSLAKRAEKYYTSEFIDILIDLYDPLDESTAGHWSTYNQVNMIDKHVNSFYPCSEDIHSAACSCCERAYCPYEG